MSVVLRCSPSGACTIIQYGDKEASVCVAPSKDLGEKDIIWVEDGKAKSLRSTTEVVNKALICGADMKNIDDILVNLNKELRPINEKSKETKIGPVERKTKEKA